MSDAELTLWALWDLDDTLGNSDHRQSYYEPKEGKRIKNMLFHNDQDRDPPMWPQIRALIEWRAAEPHHRVAIITTAWDYFKHARAEWLQKHGVWDSIDEMWMRSYNDLRHSSDLKRDIVTKHFAQASDRRIAYAVDDREPVIQMYRELDIIVYHPDHFDPEKS